MLIIRGLIGVLINLGLVGAFLILPAGLVPGGTWCWPRGLLFLGVYTLLMGLATIVLAVKAPASLEARLMAPASGKQEPADRIVTGLLMLWFLVWLVAIPVEVFYWKLLPRPELAVTVGGAVLSLSGFVIIMTAIFQNSFALPIVEDQSDRGQVLVDTGLYGYVRHPLYLGMLAFLAGLAIWLGSYLNLVGTLGFLFILIARILVEEKTLRKTLPGYLEYMKKVPYRVVPLIW